MEDHVFLNTSFTSFSVELILGGVSNFNKKTIGVMPVSLLSVYLFTVTTSSLQNISIRFSNFYKRSSRLADFSAKSSPEKE